MNEESITIEVQFYGLLREKYPNFCLTLPKGSTVATLKEQVWQRLPSLPVAHSSIALANETTILRNHDVLQSSQTIAALPPVSGG